MKRRTSPRKQDSLRGLRNYDAHMHVPGDHAEAEAAMIDLGLKGLNIAFAEDESGGWRRMADFFRGLSNRSPDLWAWCTTFPPPGELSDAEYLSRVVSGLEADFRDGAVACKVWKNIGMRVRRYGRCLTVDDPLFDPVWDVIEEAEKPLILHIADPVSCWMPLSEDSPHAGYYRSHPEWHMYGKAGVPSHEELIAGRDRLVRRRPGIRFVGAHLGSLEHDIGGLSKRLQACPNFFVDTSGRLADLIDQDKDSVRSFFIDHSDRILYGSDLGWETPLSRMPAEERSACMAACRRSVEAQRTFLSFAGTRAIGKREIRCLGLSPEIVESVMCGNAFRLFEG